MNVAVGQLAVGDPSATRTVYTVVAALGLIGVVLMLLAIWLVRQTKPERQLLAPLELMNDRAWRKQDPANQRRSLDEVRPEGATPVAPERTVPAVDAEFDKPVPRLASFDDLSAQLLADAAAMSERLAADADSGVDDGDTDGDGADVESVDEIERGGAER